MADSWRLTEREKRGAWTTAFTVASTFFGGFAPAAMWGFEYLYDRRDLIFGTRGTPTQAVASDGSLVRLSALGWAGGQQSTPLTIVINLDNSALNLGLKKGDPVSVVVTGHSYVQSRSGLVVPARVGQPVTVAVPRGSYSVGAFGSKQGSLFTASDPYRAVGGSTTPILSGSRQLAVPLTAREPLIRPPVRAPLTLGNIKAPLGNRRLPAPSATTCAKCGQQIDASTTLLAHILTCQGRPASHWANPWVIGSAVTKPVVTRSAAISPNLPQTLRSIRERQPTYRCPECNAIFYSQKALDDHRAAPYKCDRCGQRFATSAALNFHFASMHPLVKWWRDFW